MSCLGKGHPRPCASADSRRTGGRTCLLPGGQLGSLGSSLPDAQGVQGLVLCDRRFPGEHLTKQVADCSVGTAAPQACLCFTRPVFSCPLCHSDKHGGDRPTCQEPEFTLAQSSGVFSPWPVGPVVLGPVPAHVRASGPLVPGKQRRRGETGPLNPSRAHPHDLPSDLHEARPPKAPEPPGAPSWAPGLPRMGPGALQTRPRQPPHLPTPGAWKWSPRPATSNASHQDRHEHFPASDSTSAKQDDAMITAAVREGV